MDLAALLERQGWILADGATATNLFNEGLEAGEAPELWNTEQPTRVTKLYTDAVNAGAQLFLTNSFGSNRARLKLHDASHRSHELSRVAAMLAREVADGSASDCIVAGSMGPTGELMAPMGDLTHSLAVELFHEQANGLAAGGVDVLWIETMSAEEEFLAAVEACRLVDIPWCGTMSFDTAGRTMMGITPARLVELASTASPEPVAFGANCGSGISDLMNALLEICARDPRRPVIAKGNAGIPTYVDGRIHYAGSPEVMADYAEMARNAGASIIGGCCGTSPAHLARMRERLETATIGPPPELDEIVLRLGPLSYAAQSGGARRRTRRRRRRASSRQTGR
ncbi:MAG: betaine--homocysteine S-methyltransferase [Rhodobacteraceae bacterium]|nr:betaine--homocysteine S-methyltransferase [Paracoccaceae bacterium]